MIQILVFAMALIPFAMGFIFGLISHSVSCQDDKLIMIFAWLGGFLSGLATIGFCWFFERY